VKRSPWRSADEPDGPREAEPDGDGLATALHEVSNALTVILGWLDIARERAADAPTREAVELALEHARLGYGVARQAVGAELVARDEERSAAGLARATILAVTPRARAEGVQLRLDTATGVDDHLGDADALTQILLNLLLNAVAFTDVGGHVALSLRETAGTLVFRVTDQGPGIPPERVSTLFSDGSSTREGGAGIGLRHSSRLASRCGGSLTLAHAGPGACFELSWPKSGVRSGARSSAAPVRLEGKRILVLEDDPAVLGLIEIGLEARGATVVALSGRDELDALALSQGDVAAALLDLSPIAEEPHIALGTLRRVVGEIPIVLITGSASGIPEAVQSEIRAWVRKPFEMGEVIDVLGSLVRRSG